MSPDLLLEILRGLITRKTLDAACRDLKTEFPEERVDAARRIIEHEMAAVRILWEPGILDGGEIDAWYPGPSEDDRFWPPYLKLLEGKSWHDDDIDTLAQSSSRIVGSLHHPGTDKFRTTGLVLGYVQSGKTANFTAVITKAVDAGYRMVVVLSGLTNKLRRQTQQRLDRELINLNPEHWVRLTNEDCDFGDLIADNANVYLTRHATSKTLCVIKKNSYRLKKLRDWFQGAKETVLNTCPVLVIDDEADQASLNSARNYLERTRINELLLDLLTGLPRVAYVGYTATPFANVFVDPASPDDLYPRHFIVSLPAPESYFAPERLFGRDRDFLIEEDEQIDGLDVIRSISISEVDSVRPANAAERHSFTVRMEDTPALREALKYFWLATAARWARGQQKEHSTMLIHTTQYADGHIAFLEPLSDFTEQILRAWNDQEEDLIAELSSLWTRECRAFAAEEPSTSFDELSVHLGKVLETTLIRAENYLMPDEERMDYGDEPLIQIVVGGNILARGLTMEGLVTSYFVRSANAYDTLLQMGRWFGYRPGYGDLPRVWMTDELRSFYFELAAVEHEIRSDIERYALESSTPLEFAPRIRTHPNLMITSRLKMRNAISCSISYSNSHIQTILFNHKDEEWLNRNIQATTSLISVLSNDGSVGRTGLESGDFLFSNASSDQVIKFIKEYQFHENSWNLNPDMICDYIADENHLGLLLEWSVAVLGRKSSDSDPMDLGAGVVVNRINRSRIRAESLPYANIKALMSRPDAFIDLELPVDAAVPDSWQAIEAVRNAYAKTRGLLLLYPIAKDSKGRKSRMNLDAVTDVIGVALVFPKGESSPEGRKYMTADLSAYEQEQVDIPDEQNEEGDV
ncbi:Z1 domain-containing protein [Gemmatimonadota bacterium]